MPRPRCCAWSAEVPTETVAALTCMIKDCKVLLMENAPKLAKGPTLQKEHWAICEMMPFEELLVACFELDPRGAVFAQSDFEDAFVEVFGTDEDKVKIIEEAEKAKVEVEKFLSLIAWRTRHMLSSLRNRKRHWVAGADMFLDAVFAPTTRGPRVGVFFTNYPFADNEDETEDENEDNESETEWSQPQNSQHPVLLPPRVLVSSYYDGKMNKAMQLFSDGEMTPASRYTKGERGFAIAVWDAGEVLQLELPNSCVSSDEKSLSVYKPPSVAPGAEKGDEEGDEEARGEEGAGGGRGRGREREDREEGDSSKKSEGR